jgi:solute carrier family 25 (mitochondrial phosphate transporter), member 23/24/25/41
MLKSNNKTNIISSSERMIAGAFAGICSVVSTYPLDIIRTRLSLADNDSNNRNRTIISCGADIVKKEGGFLALYRGLSPTVAGIAPYVALNFTVYESLKSWLDLNNVEVTVEKKLICGGFGGALAQTVTYPFDVIRRRMQVTYSPDSKFKYKNSFDAANQIVKKDGFKALYKGILPNYLKVVPAISISFATFEFLRKIMMGE